MALGNERFAFVHKCVALLPRHPPADTFFTNDMRQISGKERE